MALRETWLFDESMAAEFYNVHSFSTLSGSYLSGRNAGDSSISLGDGSVKDAGTGGNADFDIGAGDFSIATWLYFTGSTGTGTPTVHFKHVQYPHLNTGKGLIVRYSGTVFSGGNFSLEHRLHLNDGTNDAGTSYVESGTVPASTWHLCVVTYDASARTVKFYRNGTKVHENTAASTLGNIDVAISARLRTYQQLGRYDQISVYNSLLSPTEVSNLYNNDYAPTISSHPSSTAEHEGDTATFSVSASISGGYDLYYQWYKDGSRIAGATSSSYTTPSLTLAYDGSVYYCRVIGETGRAVSSNNATLSVYEALSITSQPSNQKEREGENASFSITASGESLTYQWYKVGTGAISGATSSTYTINNVSMSLDGTEYYCIVTDTLSDTLQSNTVSLDVVPDTVVTSQPDDANIYVNENAIFSATVTGESLTYQWYKVGTGAISGATTDSYTINNVSLSLDGTEYYLQITDSLSETTNTDTVTLSVSVAVSIYSQPTGLSEWPIGTTGCFDVGATGTGLIYQWYIIDEGITGTISGATGSEYCRVIQYSDEDDGIFVLVTDTLGGEEYSSIATIDTTWVAPTVDTLSDKYYFSGNTVTWTGAVTGGSGNYIYQWQKFVT